ncbi:hypothetical protein mRhiFer1_008189 [Rhinolophus ferrumequinum]|uniref:G-protein coupled receptors family 3 profile domain-containing protein n=1 Tax=Rhinolophus ferrumequinum TaxID=59479 RepID=A0A7J7W800_RHIFE|nr:hypothetical protein mRhiFer1_008189 [Rhinolophus ferrumequinum]
MATVIASSPAATVIICDFYHYHFTLMAEALWENMTRWEWILFTSFSYNPSVLGPKALDMLNGSLSLSTHAGIMPSFEDFLLALHPATYPGNSLGPSSICSDKCPVGTRKSVLPSKSNCCYNCIPCPRGEIAMTPDGAVCEKCPEDQWPNMDKSRSIPKTLGFLPYREPFGTALAVGTALLFLIALAVLGIFIWHHHTPSVRSNNHRPSYLLLSSLALCFLCPFLFIGHPGHLTCAMHQAAFRVTFTISVSSVLARPVMVVAASHTTQPHTQLRKWTTPALPAPSLSSVPWVRLPCV